MSKRIKLRVICPTPGSQPIADTLAASGAFEIERWARPKTIAQGLEAIRADDPPHVLAICALGLVVRLLNRQDLAAKADQASLLVATEDGQTLIPVLGGHSGGNALARQIAAILGGQALITTASDQNFEIALDDPPPGWILCDDQNAFSKFMQTLLEDGAADLSHAPQWLQQSAIPHRSNARLKITWHGAPSSYQGPLYSTPTHLIYATQRRLVVGLGCERGCPREEIEHLMTRAEQHLDMRLTDPAYASIDLKFDEPAFLEIAPHMRFFSAEDLSHIQVPNPSEFVRAEVGTPSVAEASALALAGPGAELILPKIKTAKATLAVALAKAPLAIDRSLWTGRPRPRLQIVGLGPGAKDLCSPAALRALKGAQTWVGYSLYLDQAAHLTGQKTPRLDFNLGDEEARCRAALDAAAKGQNVALICSGDPQVYAMAQVVYELIATCSHKAPWQQIQVETLPGITAMQALAAKVGAPLGHDFCAISLSDLNTPWQKIEQKVMAAAQADFVIGFYNPRSKRRHWQLPRALEILRAHRPENCPVAFGRNVSRPDQTLTLTTLGALCPEDIDMFTCLIVGASFTQHHRNFIFTPRGYDLDTPKA